MDGILLINKEKDMTSRDVVNKVSRLLGTKKIGHTGTLDPMATGVLMLCIGHATKLNEILTSTYKEYEAEITLGLLTDTLDITGNVIEEFNVYYEKSDILSALDKIKGKYIQEVPIYSAVKVNGKKLYEYARNKEKVELPKREVDIKEIDLISDIKYENNKVIFSIRCLVSKGTYIRALVNDIAKLLNTVGVMSKLVRTKQGRYNIEDCYSIEDILNNKYEVININDALSDFKRIEVDPILESKIRNGAIIDNVWDSDKLLFAKNEDVLALYKIYEKDNTKLKPWKMFTKN